MTDIDQLRKEMETVTLEMIELLQVRTEIAKKIGMVKKNIGKDITDEARENDIRRKVIQRCGKIGLDERIAARFLNFLLNESVKAQSDDKDTHMEIFLKAKSLEAQGRKIIHMEVGEPDFLPPDIVRKALEEVYDKGFLKYGPAKGMPELREALAKHISENFNAELSSDNVMVSPGARFSIFTAISALLSPGDEMIVIEPTWPAYRDCALNAGVKVRTIRTTLEGGWTPSLEQIRDTINSNTKMIILNYPNNPTGKVLDEKLQKDIIKLAETNDLYVLSDETYSQYARTDSKSILNYNYKKGIMTGSFSKSHAMTGFRIGYAVADAEVIEEMAKLQSLCLTNVSEPIQYIAMKALKADTSKNTIIIQDRLELLAEKARSMGLDFVVPDGSMYLFARVNKDGFDGSEFANIALENGVAVAPGEAFGNYRNFVRISACQDRQTLIDGMNILESMIVEGVD